MILGVSQASHQKVSLFRFWRDARLLGGRFLEEDGGGTRESAALCSAQSPRAMLRSGHELQELRLEQ